MKPATQPRLANAWRCLAATLAVSVAARFAVAVLLGDSVTSLPGIDDQRSYHMLAQRVLHGFGFTVVTDWWPLTKPGAATAHWSYLYTLYLTGVYAVFGVKPLAARLIQVAAVSTLWPLLTYRIARKLAGERVALIAAAWSAVYGYFAYYSAALMTEPFFITSVLWSLDLALGMREGTVSRWRWAALGLAAGIAVLLRQSYLLFVPFLLLWLIVALRSRLALSARLRRALLSLAVVGALILPWTVRNYLVFDRFVPLNTNAGYAFFWANHPIYGTDFQGILPEGISYQSLVPEGLKRLNEAALDSALMKEGLGFVLADPGRYLLLSLSRLKTYFMFWPSAQSSLLSNLVRVLSFAVALPFMLWGMALAARQWRRWSLLYLFVAVYSGLHLASWALIRYRLPVDAVALTFASMAVADLVERLSRQPRAPALLRRLARPA